MFYHQNRFEEAIKQYETVLKSFPEVVPESIKALVILAQAAVEYGESQEDEEAQQYWQLYSGAVAGYIADRFARSTKEGMTLAGDQLRSLQTFYATHNLPELSQQARADFFRLYPEHPAAANTVMQEAERLYKDQDYEKAMPLYRLLMENYTKKIEALNAYPLENEEILDGRITGTVRFDEPGILALSVLQADGWTVKVDGEKVSPVQRGQAQPGTLTANVMYQGILIPAGEHTVELTYETPGSAAGYAAAIPAMLLFLVLFVLDRRKRRKEKVRGQESCQIQE